MNGVDGMTENKDVSVGHPTHRLAQFASRLSYGDLPVAVIDRAKELLIDWVGSALAGRESRPVLGFQDFASQMGPADGPSEILTTRRTSSPYFAAMVNAASSHAVEQDDVHNGSVFHPAAVVFPTALAVAQSEGRSGRDLLLAVIAGYEVGIRVGEFLGRSHYAVFHTTGTAGTLAAAATAGKLLGLDSERMNHAFGSAGHAGRRFMGISARRRRLEAAPYRKGGGGRDARRFPGALRRDWCAPGVGGAAGLGRRHIAR